MADKTTDADRFASDPQRGIAAATAIGMTSHELSDLNAEDVGG